MVTIKKKLNKKREKKMINAKLERYMTGLYVLSHKVSAFIYILN